MRNPLDTGEIFDLPLMNPNPTSSKTKDGPVYRISFEVEQELWQHFMDANTKGMLVAAKAQVVQDGQFLEEEPEKSTVSLPEKGGYGHYAKKLYTSGFLINPDLLQLLGGSHGDRDYEQWVIRQPCVICGQGDYDDNGDIRNEPAHILTAAASPARAGQHPNKPAFWQVPMCHAHHALQHQKGYSAAFAEKCRLHGQPVENRGLQEVKDWFVYRRHDFVSNWVKLRLYRIFQTDSLTKIPPEIFYKWAKDNHLAKWLPAEFKP